MEQAYGALAVLALFALVFSVIAPRLQGTWISEAIVFTVFGAMGLEPAIKQLTWQVFLSAAFSLTVIRMLPVFVSVAGLGLRTEAKLFAGWFGPRGLASIVFVVIVMHAKLPGGELLTRVVAFTVVLSVLLHGLSAAPWARAFGEREAARANASPAD